MSTIKIKSNYNDFIKRIQSIPEAIDRGSQEAIEKLLDMMCEEMKAEINNNRATWSQYGSPLSMIDGNDITYTIRKDGTGGTIYVGRNTPKILVGKGNNARDVNPYLFIEFGYGIQGENHPVQYASQRGWEYNINNHQKAWAFVGIDGEWHSTNGRIGIDFFYRVIERYRDNWKAIASQAILNQLGY